MTLRELRLQNKMTLKEVAYCLKVGTSTVSNYEQGTRTISLEPILTLADLYGETAETIIRAQLNSRLDRGDSQPKH